MIAAGDDGRELLQELDGLEEAVRGAIAPDSLEFNGDAAIGAEADAILGERGPEEVTTEMFETSAIVRGHPDVGVEIEAVELRLTRAAGGDEPEVWFVAEAADAGARPGAEGDTALHRGADKASQDG